MSAAKNAGALGFLASAPSRSDDPTASATLSRMAPIASFAAKPEPTAMRAGMIAWGI